eukprot:gene6033-7517_t
MANRFRWGSSNNEDDDYQMKSNDDQQQQQLQSSFLSSSTLRTNDLFSMNDNQSNNNNSSSLFPISNQPTSSPFRQTLPWGGGGGGDSTFRHSHQQQPQQPSSSIVPFNIDILPGNNDDEMMNDGQFRFNEFGGGEQQQQLQQHELQQSLFGNFNGSDNDNIDNGNTKKTDDQIYHDIIEREIIRTAAYSKELPLHLANTLKSFCELKIESLKNEFEKNYYIQNKKQMESLLRSYEIEKNTWDIIYRLYQDRDLNRDEGSSMMNDEFLSEVSSQKTVLEYITKTNHDVRENAIIIEWLEGMASNISYNADPVHWSKTLQKLTDIHNGRSSGGVDKLVSELDADAPNRQNATIDKDDDKEQHQFLSTLWSFLRAGDNQKAIDFCVSVGQFWRAQTLMGDAFYGDEQDLGNPYHSLWRFNCKNISSHSKDLYEKAIYGIYCGNISSVLQVSKNWYDYLWAYLKVLFNERIYQELKQYRSPISIEEDIDPQILVSSISQINTPKEILNILKNNSPLEIKSQSNDPYHIIQEMIINDDYQLLIDTLSNIILKNHQSPEFKRLSVNLILFYRTRENYQVLSDSENSPENIIINSYIDYLINTSQIDLIAMYTSFLNNDGMKTKVYSKFLETITEPDQRQKCLGLAEKFGLDTKSIAESVVTNITATTPSTSSTTLLASGVRIQQLPTTTSADITKIDSIRWLCFDPQLRIKAILQSNLLIREFITSDKYDACQQLLDSLPKDSITVARNESTLEEADTVNILKEFYSWTNYIEATNRINVWIQNYSKKPSDFILSNLKNKNRKELSYAQKLDLEIKKNEYDEVYGQWSQNNEIFGEEAIQAIKTIIKQSWLCPEENQIGVFDENDENGVEIHQLRMKCIPPLFKSLNTILVGTGQLNKSSKICNIIADERFRWYNVFTKEELQEILYLTRESFINSFQDKTI